MGNNFTSMSSNFNTGPEIMKQYGFQSPPTVGGFGAPEKLLSGGYRVYDNRNKTFTYGGGATAPTGNQAQQTTQGIGSAWANYRPAQDVNRTIQGQQQNPWTMLAQRLQSNNTYGANPGIMPYWMSLIQRMQK